MSILNLYKEYAFASHVPHPLEPLLHDWIEMVLTNNTNKQGLVRK